MRRSIRNRDIAFRHEDGCLLRTITGADERTYTRSPGRKYRQNRIAHGGKRHQRDGEKYRPQDHTRHDSGRQPGIQFPRGFACERHSERDWRGDKNHRQKRICRQDFRLSKRGSITQGNQNPEA